MNSEPNAASVALIEGERVLLIRRALPPYSGLWTLPGGRREPGETIERCAIREVQEELGLQLLSLRRVGTYPVPGTNWMLAVFATDRFEGRIAESVEITEHRWVRRGEIAALAATEGLEAVLAPVFDRFAVK